MDASSLFGGGPPGGTAAAGATFTPSNARDDAPRSAASLFGGEPEDNLASPPGSGEGQQIQGVPDDLFGGGGGGSGGFG
ncbi:unnamed protein product, partial [Ectocarpus sp. 8 AP-2014]